MTGSGTELIVGHVTLDKLRLNLNGQMFQLARARRAEPVAGVENRGHQRSRRRALSVPAFQHVRDVEQNPDLAVERLFLREPEIFMAPDDDLWERKAALAREVEETTAKGYPGSKRKVFVASSLAR